MSSDKIVDALVNNSNLDAEDAFKETMKDKVADAIDDKKQEIAKGFVKNHLPETETQRKLNQKKKNKKMKFEELYTSIFEKDEHKKSKEYRKLSPKMKKAVDEFLKKWI